MAEMAYAPLRIPTAAVEPRESLYQARQVTAEAEIAEDDLSRSWDNLKRGFKSFRERTQTAKTQLRAVGYLAMLDVESAAETAGSLEIAVPHTQEETQNLEQQLAPVDWDYMEQQFTRRYDFRQKLKHGTKEVYHTLTSKKTKYADRRQRAYFLIGSAGASGAIGDIVGHWH